MFSGAVWRLGRYVLFFIYCPFLVLSQEDSTLITSVPTIQFYSEGEPLRTIDTSLNDFYYLPEGLHRFQISTGNRGAVKRSLVFAWPDELGFTSGFRALDSYSAKAGEVSYYNVRKPFTRLHYIMGSKEEQSIDAVHTQNITPQFNVGLAIRKGSSIGFFERQKTNVTNLIYQNSYSSKSDRYGLLLNGIYNQWATQESGGIASDSLFENEGSEITSGARNVFLSGADNEARSRSFYFKHYVNLGQGYDTLMAGDSLPSRKVRAKTRITHSFQYINNSFRYRDAAPDSTFYAPFFIYTGGVLLDTSYYRKYENRLSFDFLRREAQETGGVTDDFAVGAWFRHQYIAYFQDTIGAQMRNYMAGGRVVLGKKTGLLFRARAEYIFAGTYAGDYNTAAEAYFQRGKWLFNAGGFYQSRRADYIKQRYSSGYLTWDNKFQKVQPMGISAGVSQKDRMFSVSAALNRVGGYVYYDFNALPKQLQAFAEVLRISSSKQFDWKNWHFRAAVHWQKVQRADVIRLPEWVGHGSVFYENYLFKGKLQARFGVDAFWNSAYFADNWMPLTGQFYLQDERKVGNYPFFDAFAAVKISKVRLYFKSLHLNQGLTGYDYYLLPHYPAADRTFRFGVNWMFFD